MNLRNRYFIIDGNWFFYLTYYRVKKILGVERLSLEDENFFINNILSDLLNVMNKLSYEYTIFVFDSAKGSWRKNYYPEYKANREDHHKDDVEKLYKQILLDKIEKIISSNLNVFSFEHCEGDDIIYALTQNLPQDSFITIHTKDRDIHQLINNRINIFDGYNFIKREDVNFLKFFKILLGDASDNIPRILKRGIGPKKIKELYEAYGSNLDFIYSKKSFNRLKEVCKDPKMSHDDMLRNAKLIILDYDMFPLHIKQLLQPVDVSNLKISNSLNIKNFINII